MRPLNIEKSIPKSSAVVFSHVSSGAAIVIGAFSVELGTIDEIYARV